MAGEEGQIAHLADEDDDGQNHVHGVGARDAARAVDFDLRAWPSRPARHPARGRCGGFSLETVDLSRTPDPKQGGQTAHRDESRDDIGQLRSDEVGHQELNYREGDAGDEHGRQDLAHPAPAGQHHYQVARDEDREKRQLAPDHCRQREGGRRHVRMQDRRDQGAKSDDWDADRAEGHRRCIGQQGQDRSGHGLESKARQDRCGDRDRRAEAGDSFEKSPKAEGNQQCLQAPVLGEPRQRTFDDVEIAAGDGQIVKENGVEHDPADRPQAERHAFGRRPGRHANGHAPDQPGEDEGGEHRRDGADPGRQAQQRQHDEEHVERESRDQRRQQHVAEDRLVGLMERKEYPHRPPFKRQVHYGHQNSTPPEGLLQATRRPVERDLALPAVSHST